MALFQEGEGVWEERTTCAKAGWGRESASEVAVKTGTDLPLCLTGLVLGCGVKDLKES